MSAIPGLIVPQTPAVIIVRTLTPMSGTWIPPTVWIEEQHRDSMVITEHPVETGAPISDHAYKRPAEVMIRLGWNGESAADLQTLFAQIITLQGPPPVLFDLQTGKRKYINMLIADVSVMTDERTEFVLMASLRCKQVILVSTKTAQVSSNVANQAIPQSTAGATNSGQTSLSPSSSFNSQGIPTDVSSVTAGAAFNP